MATRFLNKQISFCAWTSYRMVYLCRDDFDHTIVRLLIILKYVYHNFKYLLNLAILRSVITPNIHCRIMISSSNFNTSFCSLRVTKKITMKQISVF